MQAPVSKAHAPPGLPAARALTALVRQADPSRAVRVPDSQIRHARGLSISTLPATVSTAPASVSAAGR